MIIFQALAVSLLTGLMTWTLHHRLQRGPVLASAVATLTAGLILPGILEQGPDLVPLAACASYVSMSATIRLRGILEIGLALILAAVIFLTSMEIFVGVGGKLGTIAAVSVMTVWGGTQIVHLFPKGFSLARISRLF